MTEAGRRIADVPPLPVRIVAARYGLDGSRPRSVAQVAFELGISKGRVREIEARVLATENPRRRARPNYKSRCSMGDSLLAIVEAERRELAQELEWTKARSAALENGLATAQDRLAEAEAYLEKFKRDNGDYDLTRKLVHVEDERDGLAEELAWARLKLAASLVKATPRMDDADLQGELDLEKFHRERLEKRLVEVTKPKPGIPLKVQFIALAALAVLGIHALGLAGVLVHYLIGAVCR
jgi:hypothetical protein